MAELAHPELLKYVCLHITNRCNFNCSYCYVPKAKEDMSLEVAYRAVRFARALYKDEEIVLTFFGGEPLLVFEKIKRITRYARRFGIKYFLIDSNGLCLDKKKIAFCSRNNIDLAISVDGIAKAHNVTRRLLGNKTSWKEMDKRLGLLNSNYSAVAKREAFNPPCVGLTFTPKTVNSLGASVRYLVGKFIGNKIYISMIPAMPLIKEWGAMIKQGALLAILRKQMRQIADLFLEKLIKQQPFNFTVNFCFLIDKWSDPLRSKSIGELPFCGAGAEKLFISLDGGIFPCHIPASLPLENKRFCAGNVFEGITNPKAFSAFASSKNKAFSCLYWNYAVNKNTAQPAEVYSILYKSWIEAIRYIRKQVKSRNIPLG